MHKHFSKTCRLRGVGSLGKYMSCTDYQSRYFFNLHFFSLKYFRITGLSKLFSKQCLTDFVWPMTCDQLLAVLPVGCIFGHGSLARQREQYQGKTF